MTSISLSKLFERSPELRVALNGLLAQMGDTACICGPAKNVLAGSLRSSDLADHPIYLSGETIGWVSNGAYAPYVAALVEYIVRREEEKKALGAELIDRYREVNFLYHLSEHLAASPHPESIISVALEEALRSNKAKAGLILTLPEREGPLHIAAVSGCHYQSALKGDLIERVIQTRKADIANDTQGENYFPEEKGQMISLACAPIKTDQHVQGLIVLVRDQGSTFSANAIKLLNSIAMQIAPLLEVMRLYQVAIENERIGRELLMARQVQESLLPTAMPQISGWDFAKVWHPAREVSGDFYDLIYEGPGRLGLVIADVTDKGMPASLFMAFTRTALRASIGQIDSPAAAVHAANQLVCEDSFESLFTTLFYARLSTDSGELTYVNAGHNPPLFYRSEQDEILLLSRTGLPLGIDIAAVYEEQTVKLQPGDFILFYTDGITEAINLAKEEFGIERVQQIIYELRKCSTEELLAGLEKAFKEYTDPAQAFDDITMLAAMRMQSSKILHH